MSRPSEVITAAVGSIVGAVFIIVGALREGIDVALDSMEFQGAVIVVVGWMAFAVTKIVAARQRAGELISGQDGAVSKP